MSEGRPSRGLPLPALGQWLVVVAAASAVWLMWSEFHRRQGDWEDNVPFPDPFENILAVDRFVKRGCEGVPSLVAALTSTHPRSRGYALYGIGQIGSDAAVATPKVKERLSDQDAEVRGYAIAALRAISQDPTHVAPDIARNLADPNPEVRDQAARELVEIGPGAIGPVLEMLASSLAASRRLAVQVLRDSVRTQRVDQRAEVGLAIRPLMNDPDADVQLEALTLLVEWNMASLAEVRELLRHPDPVRAGGALRAAAVLGERGAELLPDILALFSALDHEAPAAGDRRRFRRRLETLLRIGENVNFSILYTLYALAPQARDAVRVLIPLVQHADRRVAYFAMHSLQDVGEAAASAVPALLLQLDRSLPGNTEKCDIVEALAGIGHGAQAAAPRLLKIINQPEYPPFGNVASRQDESPLLIPLAISALEKIGDNDPRVLAALNSKLASPSPDTRVAALDALVQLDGNSSAVLAEAVKNLGDEAHTVRAHAALAIGKLSCDRREAVAPLIAALADENSYVRTAAAISLGRIGPAALAAAPALREAATDPYNSISNAQSRHGNSVRLSTIGARVRIRELNRLSAEQASRGEIAAIEPESGKILGEK